ncbi:sialate O-acetylesterase [Dysgonomonas sp. Marseille-P4361]|uniref:sialate O-acetylesterase n=1 Tax=Dysgonomonas sp. Marseille-P4361 TaxID=2161820 RepID=UPI000D55DDD4|nr:sialate O-acetylesterase [Dysgonomonas sp. Marseille-P4361]
MKKPILLFLLLCATITLSAQVKVANIFTDNMVLQAHKPIKIWGTAKKGENLKVSLGKQEKKTKANKHGNWIVEFPALDYGDPCDINIIGDKNRIQLSNILIGEVWLCSGQSNMAMRVNAGGGQVYNYKNEENNANYPNIRSFNVKPNYSTSTNVDIEGTWEICSPATVSDFSAVAYFFAREIHNKTGLPIGIINSSWGGTDIETWISSNAFDTLPSLFKERYKQVYEIGVDSILKQNANNKKAFTELVTNDIGIEEEWQKINLDTDSWKEMAIPQEWSNTDLADFDGAVWFRYTLNIADKDAGKPAIINLGKIDDDDITWINGVEIGKTEGAGHDRSYNIPANILKAGANSIVVKVMDGRGAGGFTGTPNELYITTEEGQYSLAGNWLYKETVSSKGFNFIDGEPNICNSLLYNAMIDPIKSFAIKGVIWYQGENNAGAAFNYRTLFPLLINDWRSKWNDSLPFYWVQLASFMHKSEQPPTYDHWAELREAQNLTLSLEKTGQAVTTDIGDANDIHPRNKQDVGKRLALIALNKDFNIKDIVYSGPTYRSMEKKDNKIIITFDNTENGIIVKNRYGYIEGFSIAGKDQKFVWAKAKLIDKDKIMVYSESISNPIAVRYCWEINPDVNFYNSSELPASPFRRDNWKLDTQKD